MNRLYVVVFLVLVDSTISGAKIAGIFMNYMKLIV